MILDHVGCSVSDFVKSKQLFTQALAPPGIALIAEVEGRAGFGRGGKPELWFGPSEKPQLPMHIAFTDENRAQVRAFDGSVLIAAVTAVDQGTATCAFGSKTEI